MQFSHKDCTGAHIEVKLDRLFHGKTGGTYIELGANDGLKQSNTAFLEFEKGWSGLLIEPSLDKFNLCKVNRPKSTCEYGACVNSTYSLSTIKGDFDGSLMSSVNGVRKNLSAVIEVPAFTLQSLVEKHGLTKIDFLSLDTEGYEFEILQGLDLSKHRPHYMLIEIYEKDFINMIKFLTNYNYVFFGNLTNYNKLSNPRWDGTHNDYLFVDLLHPVDEK